MRMISFNSYMIFILRNTFIWLIERASNRCSLRRWFFDKSTLTELRFVIKLKKMAAMKIQTSSTRKRFILTFYSSFNPNKILWSLFFLYMTADFTKKKTIFYVKNTLMHMSNTMTNIYDLPMRKVMGRVLRNNYLQFLRIIRIKQFFKGIYLCINRTKSHINIP